MYIPITWNFHLVVFIPGRDVQQPWPHNAFTENILCCEGGEDWTRGTACLSVLFIISLKSQHEMCRIKETHQVCHHDRLLCIVESLFQTQKDMELQRKEYQVKLAKSALKLRVTITKVDQQGHFYCFSCRSCRMRLRKWRNQRNARWSTMKNFKTRW